MSNYSPPHLHLLGPTPLTLAYSHFDLTTLHRISPMWHTTPSSLLGEPGYFSWPTLACICSPHSTVDRDGNAHLIELQTVMDQCLSGAVSSQLHHNKAHKVSELDIGEVVDKPTDDADSEDIMRPGDSHLDERANEIDHFPSKWGNVESQSVARDTDASDDCLAATSSPPATHRYTKSQADTPNRSTMTLLIVICTCSNWHQPSDEVIGSMISMSTSTTSWFIPREMQKILRLAVS